MVEKGKQEERNWRQVKPNLIYLVPSIDVSKDCTCHLGISKESMGLSVTCCIFTLIKFQSPLIPFPFVFAESIFFIMPSVKLLEIQYKRFLFYTIHLSHKYHYFWLKLCYRQLRIERWCRSSKANNSSANNRQINQKHNEVAD